MTSPTFTWNGHTDETQGAATFKVGGLTHSVPFTKFTDAFLMHRLLELAHADGQRSGQRALAQLVAGTLEQYR